MDRNWRLSCLPLYIHVPSVHHCHQGKAGDLSDPQEAQSLQGWRLRGLNELQNN